jgi:WD40 repeat protein
MTVTASDEDLRPGPSLSGPYIGLVPYDEGDAPFFFGRSNETALVAANFRAARLTVVYGPSGVGKSSLLMAGVVHGMRTEAHGADDSAYAVCTFRSWRDDPLPGLRETCRAALQALAGDEPMADVEPGATLAEALSHWTEKAGTLYLVLDQFEEYLQYHPARGSDDLEPGFETEFAQLVDDPAIAVHVLLSIREDAWAGLDRFEGHVAGLFANYLRIDHLDVDSGREAITGPIGAWNDARGSESGAYEIEPALVEAVIEAAATSPGLADATGAEIPANAERERVEAPFLQLVMERVWGATVEAGDHTLTLDRLTELGGARRIVARHLDDALGRLTRRERDVASDCFAFLVSRSRTKVAHSSVDLTDWTKRDHAQVVDVLDKLCTGQGGRVLRTVAATSDQRPAVTYELYHDVLAESVLMWRRAHQRARDRRRLLRVAGILALLVGVFAGISLWAIVQQHRADKAARDAKWLAAASTAESLAPSNLTESLRLSLAATEGDDTSRARSAMTLGLETAHESGVWKLLTGHTDAVNSIDFGFGGTLVSGGADGTVRLWNVDAAKPMSAVLRGHVGPVTSVAMNANGLMVVSGGEDGTVRLWDPDAPAKSRVVYRSPDDRPIWTVDLSPDGRTVASGADNGEVRVWHVPRDVSSATVVAHHNGPVAELEFSPNGHVLASLGKDGIVRLSVVDPASRPRQGKACVGRIVTSIAFSIDGRLLACGDDSGAIRLWNLQRSRWQGGGLPNRAGTVVSVALSPDRRWAAAVGPSGAVMLWVLRGHVRMAQPLTAGTERILSVEFSSDGRFLAGAGFDGTVFVWDLHRREPVAIPDTTGTHQLTTAVFSPVTPMLAGAGFDGRVRLWKVGARVEGGEPLNAAPGSEATEVVFSANGRTLALGRDDGTVEVWTIGHQNLLTTFRPDPRVGTVTALALSPRGMTIAIGGDLGKVRLLGVRKHKNIGWLVGSNGGSATGVVFDPNGGTLATSGDDGNVRLWDVRHRPKLVARLGRYVDGLASVTFSPDGQTLATGAGDGTVRLWDMSGLRPRQMTPMTGHGEAVGSLAFSTDDRTLVSGSADGTVRLWDTRDQLELGMPLDIHSGAVSSVSVSPDARTFAATYQGGPIRVWSGILWSSPADLRSQVCALAPSKISDAQWDILSPGIGPVQPC